MKYTTHIGCSFVALASLISAGCATQYTGRSLAGGYSDTQLAPDAFRITFSGNGFTSSERTQDFALLRAADLTLSHGFRYFAIINSASGGNTSSITLPGQSYTTASATGMGTQSMGQQLPLTSLQQTFRYSNRILGCSYAASPSARKVGLFSMLSSSRIRCAPNMA
jgi:hypothetical protein